MSTRTIEVYSSQTNDTRKIDFSGSTWGDLKAALGLSGEGFTAAGGTTKVAYTTDESVISQDDDFIAIYPTKMKSGARNSTRYSDAKLREIRTNFNNIFNDLIGEVNKSKAEKAETSKKAVRKPTRRSAKQRAESLRAVVGA